MEAIEAPAEHTGLHKRLVALHERFEAATEEVVEAIRRGRAEEGLAQYQREYLALVRRLKELRREYEDAGLISSADETE